MKHSLSFTHFPNSTIKIDMSTWTVWLESSFTGNQNLYYDLFGTFVTKN